MADQTLVDRVWSWGFRALVMGSIASGLLVAACQEPSTSVEITPRGRDTVPITVHTDTFFVPVHDTTYVWCWETDHNNDGHAAEYQCDNGYRGPLF